ncbi:MAG: hypothetical protein DCC55_16585 [Chloroflexi bacterium]|nr:MAG: hypothetical protein DCC55_16585 [Chloroflexota bacterium]
MTATSLLLYFLGYAAIVVGFMGSILPVLPGPPMIWLGALLWAWGNDFEKIGWPTLTLLGILALVSLGLNFVFTTSLSRRAGVSWRAIGGALLGAFVGGLMLTAIPLIGTLIGALVGAVVGMWVVEYLVRQNGQAATNAVRAYLSGATLSAATQFVVACLMLSIFVWQAFF